MSGVVEIASLPERISPLEAVEIAYREDLDWVEDKLSRGLSALIECDKQLVVYLYKALRRRLRAAGGMKLRLIGGYDEDGEESSILGATVRQLSEAVYSGEPELCLAIPNLDVVVTTSRSGLSDKAREVIAMIYENPDVTLLGFCDPSFEIPRAVEKVFAVKRTVVGVRRELLPQLITREEARKFGVETFNPFALYKYVSGLNALRLRQLVGHLSLRLDYDPDHPEQLGALYRELREMTLVSDLDLPRVDLGRDIGGYGEVKRLIREEILDLLQYKASLEEEAEVREIEEIIPRGMLFVGPPGTGKTYFAKAMATALDATVRVVSGPELKSKWVGESEGNLRQIFAQARKSAPALVVFDEIDSFATQRGTYQGSGVEHSMVNQLLTEMDGFRKEELVFVVGTTNFPDSLDPALLRPGRFELQIEIPFPSEEDRRAILELYRARFGLVLSDRLLEWLVRRTAGKVDAKGGRFSGDHLYALCRSLKRQSIRQLRAATERGEGLRQWELTQADCMEALPESARRSEERDPGEERVIAVHEAGHAVVAHFSAHASPVERISVVAEGDEMLGYLLHGGRKAMGVLTRREMEAEMAVLFGGRAAEALLLDDLSAGAGSDLRRASELARVMVEELGLVEGSGLRVVNRAESGLLLSQETIERLDGAIDSSLECAWKQAQSLLREHQGDLERLVERLLEQKVLSGRDLERVLGPRPQV